MGDWDPGSRTNGPMSGWDPGDGGSRERSERREEVVEEEWRIDRLLEDELTAFNVDFGP